MSAANPSPAHTIRLRAAWRTEGRVATRRFNRPTNLGDESVRLAWDGSIAAAWLNGEPLVVTPPVDVSALLRPHNELVIESDETAVLATVRLEIHESP